MQSSYEIACLHNTNIITAVYEKTIVLPEVVRIAVPSAVSHCISISLAVQ